MHCITWASYQWIGDKKPSFRFVHLAPHSGSTMIVCLSIIRWKKYVPTVEKVTGCAITSPEPSLMIEKPREIGSKKGMVEAKELIEKRLVGSEKGRVTKHGDLTGQ